MSGLEESWWDFYKRVADDFERRHPHLAAEGQVYQGWLIGYLDVDPATGTAPGIQVADETGIRDAVWQSGDHYLVRWISEAGEDGEWVRCRVISPFPWHPPRPESVLMTSPAQFGPDTPDTAAAAWAPGLDGIGPHLLDRDGNAVRWLLLDGYVYDIRSDLQTPPYEKGRWAVNEWRPRAPAEAMSPEDLPAD